MKVKCPECGAPIHSQDVDIRANLGKCSACGDLFKIKELLGLDSGTPVKKPAPLVVGEPEGMRTEETAKELKISWRWFEWGVIPMILFCIVWDTAIGGYYIVALAGLLEGKTPLIALLFPLLHLGMGCWITYSTFQCLFNRTQITVTTQLVDVLITPMPSRGCLGVESKQIVHIEAVNDRVVDYWNLNARTFWRQPSMRVSITTVDGKQRNLIKGLKTIDDARYIAYKVGKFLGIESSMDRAPTG